MSDRIFSGASLQRPAVAKINQQVPDRQSQVTEERFEFTFQSLIEPLGALTDLSYAILPQPVNQPIVPSTKKSRQTSGYALALSADSECPVAVVFKSGGARLTSTPVIITPGEIVRPHGMIKGQDSGSFSGFDYGLPFGWLGGGVGRLIIFATEDSELRYASGGGDRSIQFHRESFPILAADQTTTIPNWPKKFPWTKATSQLNVDGTVATNATLQGGANKLAMKFTRVVLELTCNAAGLASPATVSVYMHYDGNAIPVYDQVTFPTVPTGTNSFVELDLTSVLNEFGGNLDYVNFVSGDATIQGYSINAYRYGVLG